MSKHVIRWQAPPLTWAEEVERELRLNPGEWALILESAHVTQWHVDELEDQGLSVRLDPPRSRPGEKIDLYAHI